LKLKLKVEMASGPVLHQQKHSCI